jgi:CBS domain-containing protein
MLICINFILNSFSFKLHTMKTVAQVLASKKIHEVLSIHPDRLVFDALQLMAQYNIGALMVMNGEALVGIFSERDYARKVILMDRTAKTTKISEVMTPEVQTISSKANTDDCMNTMTSFKIRHLPVVDEGKVVGLISIGDVVNAILTDQKEHISSLQSYITNG